MSQNIWKHEENSLMKVLVTENAERNILLWLQTSTHLLMAFLNFRIEDVGVFFFQLKLRNNLSHLKDEHEMR